MPEAMKSFLISVGGIVALAMFVPCIESVLKLLRRNQQTEEQAEVAQSKSSSKWYSR